MESKKQNYSIIESPRICIKVSDNICSVEKHNKKQKQLQFLCTHQKCFKKCELLCELCLEDKHYDHKENWVDITDFFKRVSNKVKILKEKLKGSEINDLDHQLKEQEKDWNSLCERYDRAVFGLSPTYNNIMYFNKLVQLAEKTTDIEQSKKIFREIVQYVSWDQKDKQTILNPKKFDFSNEKQIPQQLLQFNQKMKKTVKQFKEDLQNVFKNIGVNQNDLQDSVSSDSQSLSESTSKKKKRTLYWDEKDESKNRKKIKKSESDFSESENEAQSNDMLDDWGLEIPKQKKQKNKKRSFSNSSSSENKNSKTKNAQNYGFDWATEWVEKLPVGWKDILEHQSKTPCIGLIISMSEKKKRIKNEDIIDLIKERLKVFDDVQKSEVQIEDHIVKNCFILKVKTSSTIRTAKVLKALIKGQYRGEEICVKTWGSRKMQYPTDNKHKQKYHSKYNDDDSPRYKSRYNKYRKSSTHRTSSSSEQGSHLRSSYHKKSNMSHKYSN